MEKEGENVANGDSEGRAVNFPRLPKVWGTPQLVR